MNYNKQQHKNEKVFDIVAPIYDKGIIGQWLFKIIQATVKEASIRSNSKVLDAGTGTGNLFLILQKNPTLELYGIDISEKMLNQARKKIPQAHFTQLSILELDKKFKENFFDYIFVIDAFHHFPEHKQVLKKFHKILKKDGKLIITELDFGKLFNYIFHQIEPGNNWIYTKNAMKKLFKESGFTIKKQKRIGLFSYVTIGIKNEREDHKWQKKQYTSKVCIVQVAPQTSKEA